MPWRCTGSERPGMGRGEGWGGWETSGGYRMWWGSRLDLWSRCLFLLPRLASLFHLCPLPFTFPFLHPFFPDGCISSSCNAHLPHDLDGSLVALFLFSVATPPVWPLPCAYPSPLFQLRHSPLELCNRISVHLHQPLSPSDRPHRLPAWLAPSLLCGKTGALRQQENGEHADNRGEPTRAGHFQDLTLHFQILTLNWRPRVWLSLFSFLSLVNLPSSV